jgi:hypothetical protein
VRITDFRQKPYLHNFILSDFFFVCFANTSFLLLIFFSTSNNLSFLLFSVILFRNGNFTVVGGTHSYFIIGFFAIACNCSVTGQRREEKRKYSIFIFYFFFFHVFDSINVVSFSRLVNLSSLIIFCCIHIT